MTRRDEIIAGIPPAEDLDLIAVDQTGPCPDLDAAIEKIDGNRERFEHCRIVADRCIKCGEMLGDDYHVSHGAATCRKCTNQAASDMATYPPLHRTNWDE